MVSGGMGGGSPPTPRRLSRLVIAACIALIALLGIGSLLVISLSGHNKPVNYQSTAPPKVLPSTANGKLQLQDVLVNGQLHVNNGIILKPSTQPTNPSLGQLYISSDTKQLSYFNGTAFVPVGSGGSGSTSPAETVLGVTSNLLKLGNGLTLNQNTIVNSGITNLLGTQNQIAVSGSSGSVTLGLPNSVSIPGSLTAANLIGDGTGLTNLNASNLNIGTVPDARLSPNVALLDRNDQSFSGRRQVFRNSTNDTNAFSIQAADGTPELTVDTVNHQLTVNSIMPVVAGGSSSGIYQTSLAIGNNSGSYDNADHAVTGSDGFLWSLHNTGGSNATGLNFIRCNDLNCSSPVDTQVATSSQTIYEAVLQVGHDGFARIAYYTYAGPDLHFITCQNLDCTSSTNTLVENDPNYNWGLSLSIDNNGFGEMAYEAWDGTNDTMQYVHCTNASCSTFTKQAVYSITAGSHLELPDVSTGPDGFARIALMYNAPTSQLIYIQCQNADCSNRQTTSVASVSTAPAVLNGTYFISQKIGSDGFSRIAYSATNEVLYTTCQNAACSQATTVTIGSPLGRDPTVDLAIGSDGLSRILVTDNVSNTLYTCSNALCSTSSSVVVDAADYPTSLSLDSQNRPMIFDDNNSTFLLTYSHFINTTGQNVITGTNIGTSSTPFGSLNVTQANAQQLTVGTLASPNSNTQAAIGTSSAGNIGLMVQGAPGQTADLLNLQNSSGTSLDTFDANGNLTVNGTTQTNGNLTVNGTTQTNGNLTVNAVIQNTGGIFVNSLSPPSGISVTNQGTTGSTTYTYTVSARNPKGAETSATPITTTTGNTTLNGTNFNRITWSTVTGAASYSIYRTVAGGTPSSIGFLGSVAATNTLQFDDTGIGANGSFLSPTFDSTGGIYSGTVLTLQGNSNSDNANFVKIGVGNNGVAGNVYSTYAFSPEVTSGAILHKFDYNGLGSGEVNSDSVYLASFTLTDSNNGPSRSVLSLSTSGKLLFGSAYDTDLYRSAAGVLKTDSSFLDQTATNSTTAFQIQNSSGIALLTADTTNMKLTVQALVVNVSLTVNGHIISGNSSGSTTAAPQTAAGSTATCSLSPPNYAVGNDTSGAVTITLNGTGIATGNQCTISFASAYASYPRVILTPADASSAARGVYAGSVSQNGFSIGFGTAGSSATTYTFYYQVEQ
jgi:hypothetical protein